MCTKIKNVSLKKRSSIKNNYRVKGLCKFLNNRLCQNIVNAAMSCLFMTIKKGQL